MLNNDKLRIELVPWDFDSREHTERMYSQRVGCGWRSDEVEDWIRLCRAGTKSMYWAILRDGLAVSHDILSQHVVENPAEAAFIYDTATTQWQHPRTPSSRPMNPIGHVALDLRPDTDQRLELLADGETIVWVAGLYVLHQLQGTGLGREVMQQVELLARQQPLNATWIVLETMPREQYLTSLLIKRAYGARGRSMPTISVQDWYERQEYVEFRREDTGYQFQDPVTGEKEVVQNLIMWKRLEWKSPPLHPHAKEDEGRDCKAS